MYAAQCASLGDSTPSTKAYEPPCFSAGSAQLAHKRRQGLHQRQHMRIRWYHGLHPLPSPHQVPFGATQSFEGIVRTSDSINRSESSARCRGAIQKRLGEANGGQP